MSHRDHEGSGRSTVSNGTGPVRGVAHLGSGRYGSTSAAVNALREVFRHLEHTLTTIRRYGWSHSESGRRAAGFSQALQETFESGLHEIRWFIHPHSFSFHDETVWEPQGPNSDIPYNLFASGFRSLTLSVGMNTDDMANLLHWLLLEPHNDLPPEDDLATVVWEMDLDFLDYQLITTIALSGSENEARRTRFEALSEATLQFLGGADSWLSDERSASRSGLGSSGSKASPPLRALSQSVSAAAVVALDEDDRVLHQRLGRVLAMTYLDALSVGEDQVLLGPLRDFFKRYLKESRLVELIEFYSQLVIGLYAITEDTGYAEAVFPPDWLRRVLEKAALPPESGGIENTGVNVAPVLKRLLDYLPEDYFDTVARGVVNARSASFRAVLLEYLGRHCRGNESRLGFLIPDSDRELAVQLVNTLSSIKSRAAAAALKRAAEHSDENVQRAALNARAAIDPADVIVDLKKSLESDQARTRSQAIRLIGMLQLRRLVEPLVGHCKAKAFHAYPKQEKDATLEVLYSLDEGAGEDVAIELSSAKGLSDRHRQDSQIVALDFLSRRGKTPRALVAATEAAKGGLLKNRDVRDSAARAAEALSSRVVDD